MKKAHAITLTAFTAVLMLAVTTLHFKSLDQEDRIQQLESDVMFLLDESLHQHETDKQITNVLINKRPALHQQKANKAWGLAWGE